ncbi:MAG: DEAD/DEAH box helicase [Pirellula sp.]|nr:DEAD/DEAH box helicase [Pirellula sp.]
MTVDYPFCDQINLHVKDRISAEDANRQKLAAQAILKRLVDQPGVILADEVGMGKTFVAIAVAVSTALANRGGRPVVVMVPSSLKEKWPGDFDLFREYCLPAQLSKQLKFKRAEKAVDFLKLLDDPKPRRCSLIFMTHGAMSRGLDDPWVMLALIQRSLHRRRHIEELKQALGRSLGDLLQMKWLTNRDENIWHRLLQTPPIQWQEELQALTSNMGGGKSVDDDPVPQSICDLLPDLDVSSIFEALQQIPLRRSKYYEQKILDARHELKSQLRTVWKECLEKFRQRLPLLILDEAHHLKNSSTRLATLFQSDDACADADEISHGPLAGIFERMLFLTATPFQLGHSELCSVLDRFNAIHWTGKSAPSIGREGFAKARQLLKASLDRSQEAAVCLDAVWGKLSIEDLQVGNQCFDDVDEWWEAARDSNELNGLASQVVARFKNTQIHMKEAEQLLRPWVLRHIKSRKLPGCDSISRRERRPGAAILLNVEPDSKCQNGLSISGESLLPFLLASRASACSPKSRPVFAEGLASSYEAFLHTRAQDAESKIDDDDDSHIVNVDSSAAWYLEKLEALIPRNSELKIHHPKVEATVQRVLDIWMRGEKAVVFCHYVQTGRSLRRQISHALNAQILKLGSERLSCPAEIAADELRRIGDRFFDEDGPLRRACDQATGAILSGFPTLLPYQDTLVEIVRRNLRTPAFLVRFFPLGKDLDASELIDRSFESKDVSENSLGDVLRGFCSFLVHRCGKSQRENYISAVRRIQTGAHFGLEIAGEYDDDELQGDRAEQLLPNVRLVNGRTRSETRQRLMLTFNTPFYPEVLIASSVMSEGVDLHLNCRHMIHHDLCWNPSNLEQRTGRIDRIGAKAEIVGKPIQIFLPYIAETQDEKMYRVVMDRERWFNVVMGEKYTVDAQTTDKLANRVSFPAAAALELSFKLEDQVLV